MGFFVRGAVRTRIVSHEWETTKQGFEFRFAPERRMQRILEYNINPSATTKPKNPYQKSEQNVIVLFGGAASFLRRPRNRIPRTRKADPDRPDQPLFQPAKGGTLKTRVTEITSRLFLDIKRPHNPQPHIGRTTREPCGAWKQFEEGRARGAQPDGTREPP